MKAETNEVSTRTIPPNWPVFENGEATVVYYTSNNEFFKGKIESFPVTRFLLELTQHIPRRGSQYIRRYGLYASRTKGKWPDMPGGAQPM